MTTENTPTRADLAKAVADAEKALSDAQANYLRVMQEQVALGNASDPNAMGIASGAATKAANAVAGAKTNLADFDKNAKFATLLNANRGIVEALGKIEASVKLENVTGTLTLDGENVIVKLVPHLAAPDVSSFESSIAALGKRNLAAYREAGVSELEINFKDNGYRVELPKAKGTRSTSSKTPRASSNGNGTRRNLTAEFDAVATPAQHAELDSILAEEKGAGNGNSKSYNFKRSVIGS